MSILYRVHRVAAAASPQLLQAAIRRHTPSTTDVVPLLLAGREVKLQKRGPLPPPVGSVSQARKKSGSFPLFFLTFYIPVRGSSNHSGRSAGIHRSRSLCRSCRHGSPGSRSALGPGTSHSSCCHCYRQIHCSRQEKSGQQQPGKSSGCFSSWNHPSFFVNEEV